MQRFLVEANIDALVGPTHHFGGLGVGNVASMEHASQSSHPKAAALEGLQKAALVAGLGVPQYVWLPPARPRLDGLSQLGFRGSMAEQLEAAYYTAPQAFSAAFSSAFMWAANAATVTPAADASDARYHFTPANLVSSWHRAAEASERQADLQHLVDGDSRCEVHDPLPAILPLRDEGAANHMRLCDKTGRLGFNVFVHGDEDGREHSTKFLPRHTRAASEALARRHRLDPETTFFLHQHPDAISAGVFHNDVIATSHQGLWIHHEYAFIDGKPEIDRLEKSFVDRVGQPLQRIEVSSHELSLTDAVQSYFFNSQIVTPSSAGDGEGSSRMVLICPSQCRDIASARKLVESLVAREDVPIDEVFYVSLFESMANGGGPACLRFRIPADPPLQSTLAKALKVDNKSIDILSSLIEKHYPERLQISDLLDVQFVEQLLHVSTQLRRTFHSLQGQALQRPSS